MPVDLGSAVLKLTADATALNTALNNAENNVKGFGTRVGAAMSNVGRTLTMGVSAPLIGLGAHAVKEVGSFEQQINILGTHVDSTEASLQDLRQAAMDVGADTQLVGIDAAEAADALDTLYKSGLDTADIFGSEGGLNSYLNEGADLAGALRASIDLAAASDINLAQASDAVAIAMKTFGIDAADASAIADSFVGTADASISEVSDLTAALSNVGPTADQFGWSLEDVNTALGVLSTRGIVGAEAGNALKSMMTNLMRPTDAVRDTLAGMNVELYNADDTLKTLPELVSEFSAALEVGSERTFELSSITEDEEANLKLLGNAYNSVSDELGRYQLGLLGANMSEEDKAAKMADLGAEVDSLKERMIPLMDAQDDYYEVITKVTEKQKNLDVQLSSGTYGMKAMGALIGAGEEGWTDMATSIDEAASAQEVGAARTEGIAAAIEQLGGSIQTLEIEVMTPFVENTLTPLVAKFTEIITEVAKADPELLNLGLTIAGIAVAAGPVLMVLGALVTAVSAIGAPVLIAVAAIGALALAYKEDFMGLQEKMQPIVDKAKELGETLGAGFGELKAAGEEGGLPAITLVIQGWWTEFVTTLPATIETWKAELTTYIADLWSQLITWWDTDGAQLALDMIAKFQVWWDMSLLLLGSKVEEWKTTLGEKFAPVWQGLLGKFENEEGENPVAVTIQKVADDFGTAFANLKLDLPELGDKFTELWTVAAPVLARLGEAVAIAGGIMATVLGSILPVVIGSAASVLGHFIDVVTGVFMAVGAIIEGVIGIVKGIIHGSWTEVWSAAGAVLEGFKNAIVKIFDGVLGVVEDMFRGIWDVITSVIDKIPIEALVPKGLRDLPTWDEMWHADDLAGTADSIVSTNAEIAASLAAADAAADEHAQTMADLPGVIDPAMADYTKASEDLAKAVPVNYEDMTADIEKSTEALNKAVETPLTVLDDLSAGAEETGNTVTTAIVNMETESKTSLENISDDAETMAETIAQEFEDGWLSALGSTRSKLVDINDEVKTSLPVIAASIAGGAGAMATAGGAMMEGMRVGIMSKAGSIAAAAAGVVTAAIAAANAAAGIASPSTVFIEFGHMLMAGLSIGISDKKSEAIKAATDAVNAVIGVMSDIVSLWSDWTVTDWEGFGGADFASRVNQIADVVISMVQAFQRAAATLGSSFTKESEDGNSPASRLSDFAGVASDIAGLIGDAVDAWAAIDGMTVGEIDGKLAWLVELAREMVDEFLPLFKGREDMATDAFLSFLDSMSAAAGAVADIADAMSTIADVEMVDPGGRIGWLVEMGEHLAWAIQQLRQASQGMDEDIAAYAEYFSAAIEPIVEIAEAMQTINELDTPAPRGQFGWLANMGEMLAWTITKISKDLRSRHIGEELSEFAQDFTAAIEPIAVIAETMAVISEIEMANPSGKFEWLREMGARMAHQMSLLAEDWRTRASVDEELADFADSFSKMIAPISDIVAVMADIAEIEIADPSGKFGWLREMGARMARQITIMYNDWRTQDVNEALVQFAKDIQVIADALVSVLAFMVDLRAWRWTGEIEEKIGKFRVAWTYILTDLDLLKDKTQAFVDEDLRKWVTAMEEIARGMTEALAFIVALDKAGDIDDTSESAAKLILAIDTILEDLKPVLEKWDTEHLDLLTSFGTAVSALFGGLSAALIDGIADFVVPADDTWASFKTWTMETFQEFHDWVNDPSAGFEKEKLDLVDNFGVALGSLMGGLQTALGVATDVPDTWTVETGEGSVWASFIAFVEKVMTDLTIWIGERFPEGYDWQPITDFGTAMGTVFGGVKEGLEVFHDLSFTLVQPTEAMLTLFLDNIKKVVEKISTWVTSDAEPAIRAAVGDGTTEGSLGRFGTAMSNLFGGLSSGLGFFADLADISGTTQAFLDSARDPDANPPTTSETFAGRLGSFFGAIHGTIVAFDNYVTEYGGTWTDAAQDFKDRLDGVVSTLSGALSLFEALNEHGLPSTAQIQNFVDLVVGPDGLFPTFTAGLAQSIIDIVKANIDIALAIEDLETQLPTDTTLRGWGANIPQQIATGMIDYTDSILVTNIQYVGNMVHELLGNQFYIHMPVANESYSMGKGIGGFITQGIADGVNPGSNSFLGSLDHAIALLVDHIEQTVRNELAIASPSQRMADLMSAVPTGMAQGMLSGLPDLRDAATMLANAGMPDYLLGGGGAYEFDSEQHIIVDFRGEAGGTVPLTPTQFSQLKGELISAIRRGA